MTANNNSACLPEFTLLESGNLPHDILAGFAVREGRRPRPIYQIHKWFARRLGCSFRAVLVGAVEPETEDFWKAYYETANLQGLTVLDPFVGGGTSVVEASRLGATALGVDVDPIACAVTSTELSAADIEGLEDGLEALKQSVRDKIAPYYRTSTATGKQLQVVHYFWVQLVTCPQCQNTGEAHPNYLLASESGKPKWAICRACHEVHEIPADAKTLACRACGTTTQVEVGTVQSGKYQCQTCGFSKPLIEIARAGDSAPRWRLFAVEAAERTSGRTVPMSERYFLRASAADRLTYARACRELKRRLARNPDFLPPHLVEKEYRTDSRLSDYGYRHWTDLFNTRQLLHLGLLAEAIRELPQSQRRVLGLAFSNHLTTNCMLTAYAAGWRRLTPLFSIRAFRHVPRPVELNPWSEGTGRGSYPNAIRQIARARNYAIAPKEPTVEGGFREVASVTPQQPATVNPGNARNLHNIASESVDIVLTDPPYFDNVSYSELSDFFQPWLEHLNLVPTAGQRRSLVSGALRARRSHEESLLEFAAALGEAFVEVRRVLKPEGMLAFTFRHTTADGWYAMALALRKGGLQPVQVMPLPGEAGNGLHTHGGTSLWDAVLVFRKREATNPADELSCCQVAAAHAATRKWKKRLDSQASLPFNEHDFANLLRAQLVGASLGLYPVSETTTNYVDLRALLRDAEVNLDS